MTRSREHYDVYLVGHRPRVGVNGGILMLGIQAWGKLLVSSMKFPKIEWWVDDGVINCRYQNIHKQSPKCTVRDEYNTWVWINMFQSYIVYRLDVDAEIQRGGVDGSQKSL